MNEFANMAWIPGGTFLMGSDRHYAEEAPAHRVTVGAFRMDRHAVTNAEFGRFVEATGHVTLAERPVDPADYPGAKPELLVPSSVVFAKPPHRVDLRFTTPTQNHNAMEPHATTAVWDGDSLTVWDAAQNIDWFRKHLALRFDVPLEKVRVLAPFVGGGFGGKGFVWSGTLLTVMAARVTGRPVRMALTREGVYRTVGGRTPTAQRVALGATADGRLTALVGI